MKLVVTGALGHIGSRLIHSLRPGEYSEVLLIDNLATRRRNSLFGLPEGVPYRFVEADVLAADLGDLFAGARAVVHLAAIAESEASFEKPEATERVNFEGTRRVAEACVDAGAGLFFPSTTSVYAPASGTALEEGPASDLSPQTPYAAGKLRAEEMLRALGHARGLEFVIARFGTIFGVSPGMRFHTVVNRFAWQACTGLPLTAWRTALDQRRPYLDVADAAAAIVFLARRGQFHGGTYNVATTQETLSGVIDAVRRHVPDAVVRLVDSPAMNALSYAAPADKLKAEGFAFQGALDRGVGETVSMLRNARAFTAPSGGTA